MGINKAKEILECYVLGTASANDVKLVDNWYSSFGLNQPKLSDDEINISGLKKLIWKRIINNTGLDRKYKYPASRYAAVAAACIFLLSIGWYFYPENTKKATTNIAGNTIAPGGNKAVLTLANGKRIALATAANGILALQSGVNISKTADGKLLYFPSAQSTGSHESSAYNSIETPAAGTYQLQLPDGTKVWLNALSALKYPSDFRGHQDRKVELLRGEAYFEVAKDPAHPFIVNTAHQQVKVLGTHFNINTYADEPGSRTTLLEGLVQVTVWNQHNRPEKTIIRRNQQAILNNKRIHVIQVNPEAAVAWKNGYFKFDNEPIELIMKQISRWYNVKIVYKGSIPATGLGGTMSRDQQLSDVLEVLQATGLVSFSIKGNTVTVQKH